jgi:hypothetical protein
MCRRCSGPRPAKAERGPILPQVRPIYFLGHGICFTWQQHELFFRPSAGVPEWRSLYLA